MDKTTADIRNAMAKIPGLKDLVIPWERLQSDEEFQKMNDEFMKGLMASFDAEIDCDLDYDFGSPSAPASGAPAAAPGAVSEPVAYTGRGESQFASLDRSWRLSRRGRETREQSIKPWSIGRYDQLWPVGRRRNGPYKQITPIMGLGTSKTS